jgi:hypothetical protein
LILLPLLLLSAVLLLIVLAAHPTLAFGTFSSGITDVTGHWVQVASPTTEGLRAIDMLSATSGWAGGAGPTLLRYTGGSWTEVASPVITNGISAIDAVAENDVWATDYGGRILHYDGVSWQVSAALTTDALQDIKMISPTLGWAVGLNRTALRWDGTQWTVMPKPSDSRPGFYGVQPFSANDVWATVLRGIYHWDGATWTFTELTHDSTYYGAIQGFSASDMWVFGNRFAWHFDGALWTPRWAPIDVEAASMVSSTDMWAVGWDNGYVQAIAHWDGAGWTEVPCPANSMYLNAVSMVSAEDGWAVGDGGVILHYVPGPAPTDTPTTTPTSAGSPTPTVTSTPIATATASPSATATSTVTPGMPTPTATASAAYRGYLPLILNAGSRPAPTPTPTVSPSPTPTASPTGNPADGCTFSDSFDDPASGWPIEDVPNRHHYLYADGAYDVLLQVAEAHALLVNPHTWCDNSRIQVDLNWVIPVWVGRSAPEWGVVFRYVDEANYYSFNIAWTGQASFWVVRKMVNGVSTNLTALVSDRNYYFHPLDGNHPYVSTHGDQITVGAVVRGVDTPLATITDASLQAGYAGLRHYIDDGGVPYSRLNTKTSQFTQAPQP